MVDDYTNDYKMIYDAANGEWTLYCKTEVLLKSNDYDAVITEYDKYLCKERDKKGE